MAQYIVSILNLEKGLEQKKDNDKPPEQKGFLEKVKNAFSSSSSGADNPEPKKKKT